MKISEDKVPSTVMEAVDMVVNSLCATEKYHILNDPHPSYHHGAGRFVRNAWRLWESGCPLVKDAKATYQISHADDISGLIFEWAFAKIRGEPFDPHEHVKIYHEHWKKMSNQEG